MASTYKPTNTGDKRVPEAFQIVKRVFAPDLNVNNVSEQIFGDNNSELELPLFILIRMIVLAISDLANPRGSTLKDIRRVLCSTGIISETTDLRPAMIAGLKLGAIARPVWAVKAGVYGKYVEGDGIPIFTGRNNVPKQKRHRSAVWIVSKSEKKRVSGKKRNVTKKRRGGELRAAFIKRRS